MGKLAKHKWWIVALVIGAAGSALWDVALKPTIYWLALFLVRITTLGATRLADGIYCEVSKGFHEAPSLSVLMLLTAGAAGFVGGTVKRWHFTKKQPSAKVAKIEDILIATASAVFLLGLVFARTSYVNRAVAHFHQTLNVVSAHISTDGRDDYISRFSSMTTRSEYHTGLWTICMALPRSTT